MLCTISGPLWDEWLRSKLNGTAAANLGDDERLGGRRVSLEVMLMGKLLQVSVGAKKITTRGVLMGCLAAAICQNSFTAHWG